MRKQRRTGVVSPAQDHTAAELLGLESKLVLFPGQGSSLTGLWLLVLVFGEETEGGGGSCHTLKQNHWVFPPVPVPGAKEKRPCSGDWSQLAPFPTVLPSPPHSGLPREPAPG